MRTRRRRWTTSLAMFVGVLLGLYLLSTLRTSTEGPAPRAPTDHVADRAPARVSTPSNRAQTAPVLEPAEEDVEDEDDGGSVVEDTGSSLVEVMVHLEDANGYGIERGWPFVEGCAVSGGQRSGPGSYVVYIERGELCYAYGMRRDGMLTTRSDEVEFEAFAGTDVTLVFPVERTGGIGIRFQPVETGMLVMDVVPGTPAFSAGLQAGDIVVDVAGIPTADMSNEEFVESMTGPEGSDVEFGLEFEADTGLTVSSVMLTRAFLSG